MSYYFLKSTAKSVRKMFPKIILNDLRKFPIKKIDIEKQTLFIEKADIMLDLNKDFYNKKNKFLSRLKQNLNLEKITKKLDKFFNLNFADFLGELKKQKINLSLKQQDEWDGYFEERKKELIELKEKIDETDREIDKMVYKLYGLSNEEIGIVEGL